MDQKARIDFECYYFKNSYIQETEAMKNKVKLIRAAKWKQVITSTLPFQIDIFSSSMK